MIQEVNMRVEVVEVFNDNYAYLVVCEDSMQAAAVDPADAGAVARRAEALGVQITAIWSTHHHMDHTAGNKELASHRELKIYGHQADAGRIPALTDPLEHGTEIPLGSLRARVLHTPGHTSGSACFQVEDALFTGDTLFGAGCGRLFEGDAPTMFRSLDTVLGGLDPACRIFFGHEYTAHNLAFARQVEPDNEAIKERSQDVQRLRDQGRPSAPSTWAGEQQTNPFLRSHSEEIRKTLELADASPLQVFTRLRQMRNEW